MPYFESIIKTIDNVVTRMISQEAQYNSFVSPSEPGDLLFCIFFRTLVHSVNDNSPSHVLAISSVNGKSK